MKLYVLSFFVGTLIFFAPLSAKAFSVGLPFGGLVNFSIPCTCSGGVVIYYTPLYLGSKIPVTGSLWFPPVAKLYAWFLLGVPKTWNLGSYIPGASACLVVAPNPVDPCVPIPAAGTIQYMGTSKLF